MTTYSHSRLETYETCPLRYKFRYVDRIKKDVIGIEAFLGICVHQTLQKLYEDLMREKRNSLGDLITIFNETWSKNWKPNTLIVKKNFTEEHYRRTGERCLRDYYRHHTPFNESTTLGIEERIDLALGNGQYRLIGYVDRLARLPDGTVEIHDYKTSGRLPDQRQIDQNRQLALYQIAIRQRWPDIRKVRLVWHFLLFDAELVSVRTDVQLKALEGEIIRLIREIEGVKTFEPRENALCDWCEYAPECPVQKHRFKVDALPVNKFLDEEGVTLVNKYMELSNKKRQLVREYDSQMDELKEAIIAYAEREKSSVLKGMEYKIRVTKESRIKLPDAQDPRRKQLEQLLKKSGAWDAASALSSARISEFLANGSWDEAFAKEVRGLCTETQTTRIYSSKVKETERLFDALLEE